MYTLSVFFGRIEGNSATSDQLQLKGADLLARGQQLNLQAHIFGHIHEGYGEYVKSGTRFVNASTCNVRYQSANLPVVVEVGL